jgi:hypothetical protein
VCRFSDMPPLGAIKIGDRPRGWGAKFAIRDKDKAAGKLLLVTTHQPPHHFSFHVHLHPNLHLHLPAPRHWGRKHLKSLNPPEYQRKSFHLPHPTTTSRSFLLQDPPNNTSPRPSSTFSKTSFFNQHQQSNGPSTPPTSP